MRIIQTFLKQRWDLIFDYSVLVWSRGSPGGSWEICWGFVSYINIYSFSRCFYPKRHTNDEYNKRYIIKRQTVTGSACHTTFQALFKEKLARWGEVKEREQRWLFFLSRRRKRWVFRCCLKIVRDSAFQIGVRSSFHQPGTVNENVLESDFMPLCDGTTRRCSLADFRLLEGM